MTKIVAIYFGTGSGFKKYLVDRKPQPVNQHSNDFKVILQNAIDKKAER